MNMNAPAHNTGQVTSADLGARLRESAAVRAIADKVVADRMRERARNLEMAAQLERDARIRWQTRRVLAPDDTRAEDDANGVSFVRGLLTAIAAVGLVVACVVTALALAQIFAALP